MLYVMIIYIYHTWKKIGILATGCRCYEAKNKTKWQKRGKIAQINPKSKENFALSGEFFH